MAEQLQKSPAALRGRGSFTPAEGVDACWGQAGDGGMLLSPFPRPEVIFGTRLFASCKPAVLPGWQRAVLSCRTVPGVTGPSANPQLLCHISSHGQILPLAPLPLILTPARLNT